MSYIHPTIAALATVIREERVRVSALATEAGVERNRLSAVLNGITEKEMVALRKALRTRGIRVPDGIQR